MKGWWAIASRELITWRLLFLTAFVLGWLPIFLVLLPSISGYSKTEVHTAGVGLILAIFGLLMPLVLGSSLVARDLAERRAGFYFARPIGAWALWSGKVAAAWAAAWLALGLVLLPTQVPRLIRGEGLLFDSAPGSWEPLVALAVLPLLLILLAHTVAVAWRDRSVWLGFDLLGLIATVLGGAVVARTLWQAGALGALAAVQRFWAGWLVVALLLAGGFQLARGRTDLRRAHKALALALWPLLLAGVVAPFAYARWVVAAGIDDLEHRRVMAAPAGDWLFVAGVARGRSGWQPSFLFDPAHDRTLALGTEVSTYGGIQFAADGRAVAWVDCRDFSGNGCELKWLALDTADAEPIATGVAVNSRQMEPFALSADGSRIAVCQANQSLGVVELPAARLIASTRIDLGDENCSNLSFVSNDVVRFHLPSSRDHTRTASTWHFDVAARALERVRTLDAQWAYQQASDPYRGLVLDTTVKPPTLWLVDGSTETVHWSLAESTPRPVITRRFLADGRLVFSGRTAEGSAVTVVSPAGEIEREISYPGVAELALGYEMAPGRLSVGLSDVAMASWPVPTGPVHWSTELLDVANGAREKVLEGAQPISVGWKTQPRLGAAATLLFVADGGEIFRWDAATGERTVVLPAVGRG